MRALLAVVLLAAVVAADWGEAQRRFRADYERKGATYAQRGTAIRDLAAVDVPQAAAHLLRLWDTLERDAGKLSGELHKIRSELRTLREAKTPNPAVTARIAKLEEQDKTRDLRLAGIELDQSAVLQGIARMRSPEVIAWFADEGLRRAHSPVLLRAVAQRIASAPVTRVDVLLAALEKLSRPDQLVPILQALARQGGVGVRPLTKHLRHRDWAVRVAAAYALARAAHPEGVGPLVEALGNERDRSRAQREMARALVILTGERIGPYPDLWEQWWERNAANVRAGGVVLGQGDPDHREKGKQGHFYGIPQTADRIIYILDISGSMEVSMENPRWVGKSPVPADDDEESRFVAAVRELLRASRKLIRGSQYAVIVYSDHARKLHNALVDATPDEHAKLKNALARMAPNGSTNIYEALDLALRMAGVHAQATRGETRADEIFLVSDGAPTNARGEPENPERTLQAVRGWNAQKRIAIHTIGIGKHHNSGFMSQLAAENDGQYYPVR